MPTAAAPSRARDSVVTDPVRPDAEEPTRRSFGDWPVAAKVAVVPIAFAVMIACFGSLVFVRVGAINDDTARLEGAAVTLARLDRLTQVIGAAQVDALLYVNAGGSSDATAHRDRFAARSAEVDGLLTQLESAGTKDLDALRAGWAEYAAHLEDDLFDRPAADLTRADVEDVVRTAGERAAALEACLTEIVDAQTAEAAAAAATVDGSVTLARQVIGLATPAAVIVGLIVAFAIGRRVSRPLREQAAALGRLTGGDLRVELEVTGDDEVGRIAAAVNQLTAWLRSTIATLVDDSTALGHAAAALGTVSSQLSTTADGTSSQAAVVTESQGVVSESVAAVAAGTDQLSASIRDIAHNAAQAATIAAEGVEAASSTGATVGRLETSSTEIGEVVAVITAIAERTNLLALNATIEAARAGDAGRGFAIVADEVKQLATQTAAATDDIAARIQAIQGDTRESVAAIGRISALIERINGAQTTIASAVEEQTATTSEIGRSVGDAAAETRTITSTIAAVASAASDTAASAAATRSAARDLSGLSERLQDLAGRFSY